MALTAHVTSLPFDFRNEGRTIDLESSLMWFDEDDHGPVLFLEMGGQEVQIAWDDLQATFAAAGYELAHSGSWATHHLLAADNVA